MTSSADVQAATEVVVLKNPMRGDPPNDQDLPPSGSSPELFHRQLPGYRPTPLIDLPRLAERFGVGRVLLKDESNRFGLPAFKMLGASWASYCALEVLLA